MKNEFEDDLIIVPVPPLVAVLLNLEKKKGSSLTEGEVLEARDNAVCIALPKGVCDAIAESRGYNDIDPERAWEEWVEIRSSLQAGSDS
ncbi:MULTISPECIES: hypothetical protein [Xanthomonas]|uniref:Uncharacterized protein n=2 Tax=Xanthomonas TaxID=338 RepID=A0AA46SW93_9XANT|nr:MULTISPECIES: hypothetical protein [Xanthomonas]KAB7775835.1 hypothetical protein CEK65_14585 [Xanthomonas sp. LMG 12459]MDY4338865.1 hypothetical protein [Xanthomonas sp. LF07-6]UYK89748.1 hypothetical protein NG824_04725 [Xanthomonas sacchari]